MARVKIATQPWGVVQDTAGNALNGVTVMIQTLAGSAATVNSAETGGGTTSPITNSDGEIAGWIEEDAYDLTVPGRAAKRVQATNAATVKVLKEAPLNVDLPVYGGSLATALAAVPASGARVYMPGRSTVRAIPASMLPPDEVEIFGDGPATVLQVGSGVTLAGGALQWTNPQKVRVRDLTIDLNKANTPDSNNDGAQQGLYFYTANGGATRGCKVERVRVINGHRMHFMANAATLGDPLEVDFIDCDSEDSGHIGLYVMRGTRCKVVRGNYLRSQLDNIQFFRSKGFTTDDVYAQGSIAGHGVVAGPMCSEFAFLGGMSEGNAQSGWVASVRANLFRMIGQRARANTQVGLNVDVRNSVPVLSSAIDASVTTIPVSFVASDDSYLDHVAPGTLTIGTEFITYTGVTASSFTGCVRGALGSTAASHASGASVYSEVFHDTDAAVAGYLCSENLSHGLYHQYGKDLCVGAGKSFGNGIDGALISAVRTTIDGLVSNDNAGRGLALTNTSTGYPTGDHRIGESCRFNGNGGAAYEDNASDPSIASLTGSGTPEGVIKAAVGSTFKRRDGGAGTCFYVKQSGTGNTGWVGK